MTTPFEWGERLPELVGPKVRLRPVTDDDAYDLLAVFGDPEVVRYWSAPPLRDLTEARALASEIASCFASRTLFQWAITTQGDRGLLGTCSLFHLDRLHRRAEVGFALRRDAWGRGLAADALSTLIRFCFEQLDLHRLEADADPENERSLRLLARQGFRREGLLRERWHSHGEARDGVFLGLLRAEWPG